MTTFKNFATRLDIESDPAQAGLILSGANHSTRSALLGSALVNGGEISVVDAIGHLREVGATADQDLNTTHLWTLLEATPDELYVEEKLQDDKKIELTELGVAAAELGGRIISQVCVPHNIDQQVVVGKYRAASASNGVAQPVSRVDIYNHMTHAEKPVRFKDLEEMLVAKGFTKGALETHLKNMHNGGILLPKDKPGPSQLSDQGKEVVDAYLGTLEQEPSPSGIERGANADIIDLLTKDTDLNRSLPLLIRRATVNSGHSDTPVADQVFDMLRNAPRYGLTRGTTSEIAMYVNMDIAAFKAALDRLLPRTNFIEVVGRTNGGKRAERIWNINPMITSTD